MTTIVTRAGKGALLTNAEVDANFVNLNNDKLEVSAYTAADVLAKLLTVDGTGSGLDADLLDGQSAAYYTDIVSRLGYTPLNAAGGTVGGALTVNGALDVNGNITGYGITAEGGTVAGVTAGFYANFASAPTTYQLYFNGTAPSYFGGNIGIRTLPIDDTSLVVGSSSGSGTTQNGIYAAVVFPASTTVRGAGMQTVLNTAAAGFTLGTLAHFTANTTNRGAGSTITNVHGFSALNTIAVGTTNIGFYSEIVSASNTYQLYMGGTADSFFNGSVGFGMGVAGTQNKLSIRGSALTNATSSLIYLDCAAPSSVTGTLYGIRSADLGTAAVAFTLGSIYHFGAIASTKGAGSAITNVVGFGALNGIAVGTNNYGFYSNINSATNTYQLYMGGSARSVFLGMTGIGTPSLQGAALTVSPDIGDTSTGVGYNQGVYITGTLPANATAEYVGFASTATGAAAVTHVAIRHFSAASNSAGAGGAITNVYGFAARNNIATATNNFGFWSDINSATNTYQLYMGGTAQSYFGGGVGIGGASGANQWLRVAASSLTATTIATVYAGTTFASTTLTLGRGYVSDLSTAAAAFTLPVLNHFEAYSTTKGAGSTITTVRGFYAANAIAVGTNNYGFYSDINVAATTYQLYMGGTAASYFGGNVGILVLASADRSQLLSIGGTNTHPHTGTDGRVINIDVTTPSTMTNNIFGINMTIRTAASAFTLGNLIMYNASTNILGATSAVTNVYGFKAASTLAIGSNNYGFYSDIGAASTTYQLYMAGTASSLINGLVGFGIAPLTSYVVAIQPQSVASAASAYTLGLVGSIPATATSTWGSVISNITTPAAIVFGSIVHYRAYQTAIGAGSSAVDVRGFSVDSTVAHALATAVYGFYSGINNASSAYQLYMAGTATSYFGGKIAQLIPAPGAAMYRMGGGSTHPDTSATVYGYYANLNAPSTATTLLIGADINLGTVNALFTLNSLVGFRAATFTKGAASTISAAIGFYALNGIAVGTNNYGFYSDINAAANTYQLYMAGTANSYFGGNVGVRTTPASDSSVLVGAPVGAAASQNGVYVAVVGPTTASTRVSGVMTVVNSTAAAYTVTTLSHFFANQSVKGATSTVTNVMGFYASDAIAVGANNFGFYCTIPSAATNWQLYMGGTAQSYFGGGVSVRAGVFIGEDNALSFAGTTLPSTEDCIRIRKAEDPRAGTGHTFGGPVDFFITPYNAGMAIEFKGVVECWVEEWSIHNNNRGGGALGEPAMLWIGDNKDLGGLRLSGVTDLAETTIYVEIVSERFDNTSHGDMRFIVRNTTDAFSFRSGAVGADAAVATITGTGAVGVVQAASPTWYGVYIGLPSSISAASPSGVYFNGTFPSSTTGTAAGITSQSNTAAVAFTVAQLNAFAVVEGTKGAGSAITANVGYYCPNLTNGTANYGFFSAVSSGASKYQLYMSGTADSLFAGRLIMSGSNARLLQAQGAAVASANNLALGADGNRFQISGTTQINLIDNSNWQGGAVIVLHFQGAVTVKHNQAASGNNKPIMLSGAVDFVSTASDQLVLQYDSTDAKWYELSRAVI